MDTLILNADGAPLSLIPISAETWQEAVKHVWLDRADVLAYYENWEVHSPSLTFQVPAVLMLREYVKGARSICFSRENVMLRDNFTCQYCGGDFYHEQKLLTYDHVIPRARGGRTKWDNIVMACVNCNSEKAHYDTMKPLKEPKRPSYYELVNNAKKRPIFIPHHSWNDFLQWDEKLVRYTNQKYRKAA